MMTQRKNMSILLVARGAIARFDISSGGKSTNARMAARSETAELFPLLDEAAKLGESPLGSVWVLTDELFSQVLSLPESALRGLEEEQIAQALTFEAQALSGISANDSVLDWRPVQSEAREKKFWVVQISNRERNQIEELLARHGAKLLGIAPIESSGLSASVPTNLSERSESEMTDWLRVWAEKLRVKIKDFPSIPARTQQLSGGSKTSIAATLALTVIGLCSFDYLQLQAERERFIRESSPNLAFQKTQERVTALQKELGTLKEAAALAKAENSKLESAKRLPVRLLSALATHAPEGIVLEGLEIGSEKSRVRGIASKPELVDLLQGELESELSHDGYRAKAAEKRWRNQNARSDFYEFEIEIVPLVANSQQTTQIQPGKE